MLSVFNECGKSVRKTERLYEERFPNRICPSRETFRYLQKTITLAWTLSWNVSPENLGHMAALSSKQEINKALDRGLMHGTNFPEHNIENTFFMIRFTLALKIEIFSLGDPLKLMTLVRHFIEFRTLKLDDENCEIIMIINRLKLEHYSHAYLLTQTGLIRVGTDTTTLSWNVSPENLGHMAALSPKQETNNALDRGLMHGANFPEHVRNPGQRDRPRRPRIVHYFETIVWTFRKKVPRRMMQRSMQNDDFWITLIFE
ncbi:hypothetical protein WN51_05513 [Melipona quadrifasciata]|uniref:DUF4817 domain-containing protein n=1 Tax=Melipona quadrifasciata TaxID=166423 RepID=A0A0M8ZSI2_9HYME|nr:hypothetical protein WN51_05513 [Melipona quadrifasciata]